MFPWLENYWPSLLVSVFSTWIVAAFPKAWSWWRFRSNSRLLNDYRKELAAGDNEVLLNPTEDEIFNWLFYVIRGILSGIQTTVSAILLALTAVIPPEKQGIIIFTICLVFGMTDLVHGRLWKKFTYWRHHSPMHRKWLQDRITKLEKKVHRSSK